jgi:hypothetical protein
MIKITHISTFILLEIKLKTGVLIFYNFELMFVMFVKFYRILQGLLVKS